MDPTKRPAPPEPKIKVEVGWEDDDGTLHPSPEPDEALPELSPEQIEAWSRALVDSRRVGDGYVRTSRSWAKGAIAKFRRVDAKLIDKRVARDPIARAWRAQEKRNKVPPATGP